MFSFRIFSLKIACLNEGLLRQRIRTYFFIDDFPSDSLCSFQGREDRKCGIMSVLGMKRDLSYQDLYL